MSWRFFFIFQFIKSSLKNDIIKFYFLFVIKKANSCVSKISNFVIRNQEANEHLGSILHFVLRGEK